jgi:methanogenic corrinoid protein MtbC1
MTYPAPGEHAVKAHPNTFVSERLSALGPFAVTGGDGVAPGLSFFPMSQDLPASQAQALAVASLSGQLQVMQMIRSWQNLGYGLEDIYLSGIAPAARLLGDWWHSDRICFSDVSIGSLRLQQTLSELSPEFLKDTVQGADTKRMLLLNPPGSQHTLGSYMTAEFFRRGGWQVDSMDAREEVAVLRRLHTEWFDLAGFSVASDRQVEVLTTLIQKMRSLSANTGIRVMVGGPMVSLNHRIAEELGADCACADIRTAHNLISQTLHNCKPYH